MRPGVVWPMVGVGVCCDDEPDSTDEREECESVEVRYTGVAVLTSS